MDAEAAVIALGIGAAVSGLGAWAYREDAKVAERERARECYASIDLLPLMRLFRELEVAFEPVVARFVEVANAWGSAWASVAAILNDPSRQRPGETDREWWTRNLARRADELSGGRRGR